MAKKLSKSSRKKFLPTKYKFFSGPLYKMENHHHKKGPFSIKVGDFQLLNQQLCYACLPIPKVPLSANVLPIEGAIECMQQEALSSAAAANNGRGHRPNKRRNERTEDGVE